VAASLVTSVPVMPIAIPMSADFSAGASLTPSPVIATTWRSAWRASTIRSLCAGATRANTEVSRTAAANSSSVSPSNSVPVRAVAPVPTIPRSVAMRSAVAGWSPVIITVRIPARWASAIASATSSRGGSMIPTTPRCTRSRSALSSSSPASVSSSSARSR